jgi:hypothetical protein
MTGKSQSVARPTLIGARYSLATRPALATAREATGTVVDPRWLHLLHQMMIPRLIVAITSLGMSSPRFDVRMSCINGITIGTIYSMRWPPPRRWRRSTLPWTRRIRWYRMLYPLDIHIRVCSHRTTSTDSVSGLPTGGLRH